MCHRDCLIGDPAEMGYWPLRALAQQAGELDCGLDSLGSPVGMTGPTRALEAQEWDMKAMDRFIEDTETMAMAGAGFPGEGGMARQSFGVTQVAPTFKVEGGLGIAPGDVKDPESRLEIDFWDYGGPETRTQGRQETATVPTSAEIPVESIPAGVKNDGSSMERKRGRGGASGSEIGEHGGSGASLDLSDIAMASQAGAWDTSFFKISFDGRQGSGGLNSSMSPRLQLGSTPAAIAVPKGTEPPSLGGTGTGNGGRGKSLQSLQPLSPLRENTLANGKNALGEAEDADVDEGEEGESKEGGGLPRREGKELQPQAQLSGLEETDLLGMASLRSGEPSIPAMAAPEPPGAMGEPLPGEEPTEPLSGALGNSLLPLLTVAPSSYATPPSRRVSVSVAVSEDLVCIYRGAALQSYAVTGLVLVSACEVPFRLHVLDNKGFIAKVKVNQAFAKELGGVSGGEGTSNSSGTPKVHLYLCHAMEDLGASRTQSSLKALSEGQDMVAASGEGRAKPKFLPALMYRCSSLVRQVPVRIQCRFRVAGCTVHLSAQAIANPQLKQPLSSVVVMVNVPVFVSPQKGDVKSKPPAEWCKEERVLKWSLPEPLKPGGKQLLQAQFLLEREEPASATAPIAAPAVLECLCTGGMFSEVEFGVEEEPQQEAGSSGVVGRVEVTGRVLKRFSVKCSQEA